MDERPISEQIDAIIQKQVEWKATILQHIRVTVLSASPDITEEIKWRMANRPEGLAVWTCNGIICFAEIWKDNIKLLFSKGAHFQASTSLFNARLKSAELRAVEFKDGDIVNTAELTKLVQTALAFNRRSAPKK